MRIMIKGGVWKNTEDEILKAAVMKYGKNQWARISSLLVRKSAKQCKARWYEWLDPSIKKTEWTREEDEKLLHLAKLMPTQWRTIAPIVGRTPAQCLERYEKLLDAACARDENYEPSDDPRKLRPGEIDPNPESKPARPDPVDMDEDEKEMLSEARARLANTRGKKAKRKAREKQLEEARRLASLQKRRELKAAGIEARHRRRKQRGIDYNSEIPFEKRPPPGFFDISQEEMVVEQPRFPTTIEELEGKRRVDIEAQLRKQDVARNKIAERRDAPASVMQINRLNDPEAARKRSKLMLPPPQISDRELEEIAKMGSSNDLLAGDEELGGGGGVTRMLLPSYGQTPRLGMTPLRTPQRTPAGKGDAIMMEAENLARLRQTQTPLLGGENPELHPSDFSGVTPKKKEIQTPNLIATPAQTPSGGMGLTPSVRMTPTLKDSIYGTPKGTPSRGEELLVKENLRAGLGDLPAPKFEYQIVVPELVPEEPETAEVLEEDMSDKLARDRAEEAARQAALLLRRSKVLQRDLPRPPHASLEWLKSSLTHAEESVATTLTEQADKLIKMELALLLEHDNAKYPFEELSGKEKKKSSKNVTNGKKQIELPAIEDFEDEQLKEAARMIDEESAFLRLAMGHDEASIDDYADARDANAEDLMYFPSRQGYNSASVASNAERLSALQYEFEIIKKHMEVETKKAVRSEQKLRVLTQGYQVRAESLWKRIEALFKEVDTLATEMESFRMLFRQEQFAAPSRVENLRAAVKQQNENERMWQLKYENLIVERENWRKLIQEHDAEVARAAAARAAAEAEAAARAAAEAEAAAKAAAEAEATAHAEAEAAAKAAAEAEAAACAEAEATALAAAEVEATTHAAEEAEAAAQAAAEREAATCAEEEATSAARETGGREAAACAAEEAEAVADSGAATHPIEEVEMVAAEEHETATGAAGEVEATALAASEQETATCAAEEAEAGAGAVAEHEPATHVGEEAEAAARAATCAVEEAEAATRAASEIEAAASAAEVAEVKAVTEEGTTEVPMQIESEPHTEAEALIPKAGEVEAMVEDGVATVADDSADLASC
ncbi:hypothetical protein GOP47_0020792 [Adiantum capillus-veneris]|uniref:Cell division cycle 5-like protein n=1 Tax=Adiantum capillus-veneris TaxID=13818 RepID=A0A9D4UAL9_ADICA|nr:hypothetical protein GOP47_0020792 [Adiantum capillus-veneris]